MQVALVSAPYDARRFRIGENLGIKYLAAVLDRAGVDVDVFEPVLTGLDSAALTAALLAHPYELIGFSVMFDSALPGVLDVVGRLRRAGCRAHVTTGGHVPTFRYVDLLGETTGIDSVVRFEGEETLTELVGRLDEPDSWSSIRGLAYRTGGAAPPPGRSGSSGGSGGEVVVNPPRALIADLDTLPFPRRDETSRHLGDPHFFAITTRGCPFVCTFCSIPAFYKTPPGAAWRARSLENVLGELAYLTDTRGAEAISFLDDEFLVGPNGKRRAGRLAEQLVEHGLDLAWSFECRVDDVEDGLFARLRDGGLRHVFLGVESGVQRTLDMYRKRTTVQQNRAAIETVRNLGLSLATGYIMFDPFTTTAELRESVRFLEQMRIGSYKAVANKVRVYGGTQLEADLARAGRLVQDGMIQDFTFDDIRVELVHDLVNRYLAPCHEVDIERQRLQFRFDNLSATGPAVGRLRTDFDRLDAAANEFLADLMRMVIDFAERHSITGPTGAATLARFTVELHDTVTEGTAGQLAAARELAGRLSDLERR